jgi:lipopolysaccharide export system permease protein
MKMYESREMKMYAPQIVDMTDDYSGVKQRSEAKSATLVANMPEERKSEWILSHPRIWSFDEKGSLRSFQKFDNDVTVYFEPDLSTILSQKKKPEEMNYFELRRHIDILSQRDQPVHEYVTDLLRKISFPLGVLIIMVIAFSYAARTRAGTVMSAFGYGILWAVGYYALNALITALGHSGSVNPYIAAWLPNFVFLFVAVHHLKKSYRWYA